MCVVCLPSVHKELCSRHVRRGIWPCGNGARGWTKPLQRTRWGARTLDHRIKSPALYQTELTGFDTLVLYLKRTSNFNHTPYTHRTPHSLQPLFSNKIEHIFLQFFLLKRFGQDLWLYRITLCHYVTLSLFCTAAQFLSLLFIWPVIKLLCLLMLPFHSLSFLLSIYSSLSLYYTVSL